MSATQQHAMVGTVTFTEQKATYRYSTQNGWLKVRRWVGRSDDLEDFLARQIWIVTGYRGTQFAIPYVDGSATEGGGSPGLTTVELSFPSWAWGPGAGSPPVPGTDPINRLWRLVGTEEQVSLWEHPKVQLAFQGWVWDPGATSPSTRFYQAGPALTSSQVAQVKSQIDFGLERGYPDDMILTTNTVEGVPQVLIDQFRKLYVRFQRGVESYETGGTYVLRKEETVVSYSSITASHTNVGRLLTLRRVQADEPTLPSAVLIDAAKLADKWPYWLKKPATVEPSTKGLYQVTQEYSAFRWFDDWIYDAVVDVGTPT